MKSVIKRSLFIAISLALMALTVRRLQEELQIQGRVEPPCAPPPDEGDRTLPEPAAKPVAAPVAPIVAPTVTFSGTVVRNGPRFALRETAGILYPLDSAGRAWPFEGEDVRVTGKLDLDTRLLYVDAIEPSVL
jgi:hypothetical protein